MHISSFLVKQQLPEGIGEIVAERIENSFCGMLVIYKEAGYTSSDVISRLRGILHMKKIGHTGTLDPQAEGVLPVCLGNGTKVAELIADRDKEYVARMRLGVTTDTQDMTGNVLSSMGGEKILEKLTEGREGELLNERENTSRDKKTDTVEQINWNKEENSGITQRDAAAANVKIINATARERIHSAAAQFAGEIDQIPPMYSAVWSNGRRLYELAREGKTVDRKPRRVTIHEIEVQKVDLPYVTLRVVCSKGTYIRTLCEDIGKVLGTGAAMDHLLRTRVGIFTLDQALKLDDLQRMTDDDLLAAGILPDTSRKRFPEKERERVTKAVGAVKRSEESIGQVQTLRAAGQSGCAEGYLADEGQDNRENFFVPEYSPEAAARAAQIHWSVEDHIIPIDALFMHAPAVHVRNRDIAYLRNGNALSAANLVEGQLPRTDRIRVYDEQGKFCALYRYVPDRRRILPLKMFIDTDSRAGDRK